MARTVADAAAVFSMVVGSDPADTVTAPADAKRDADYSVFLRRGTLKGARIGILRQAYERATLYGLVVYGQRRIDYGKINPVEAREIFIRSALVEGDFETRAPFFAHNQKLIREIENLEHKSRRLDVLVDEELIAAFYDKAIPADIYNAVDFEQWLRKASKDQPRLLYLSREDLMRHEAAGITTELFPKLMRQAGIEMALTYHFEPGAARDGVDVRLLVPSRNDHPWVHRATRRYYRRLLANGVRIWEWRGEMMHAKTSVVDGTWTRVGSTDFNPLGVAINYELDAYINDLSVAQEAEELFLLDLEQSREIKAPPRGA